jgi:hypothetical protein
VDLGAADDEEADIDDAEGGDEANERICDGGLCQSYGSWAASRKESRVEQKARDDQQKNVLS